MNDKRIENEVAHGKYLREIWRGTFRYWETPAGKVRWARRVEMLTAHITSSMRVLEVGCGVGYFTKEIVKKKSRITAIDISPDLLEVAKDKVNDSNVTFTLANAYDLEYADSFFDTIVGSSILHHLDIARAMKEFYRVLKPEGSIYFTEPNMANPQIILQKNIPFLKRLAGDSPDETAFFRWSLKSVLQKYGFYDVQIIPFDFLHPRIPESLISCVGHFGTLCEKIPVFREIAGSLYIHAKKNNAG